MPILRKKPVATANEPLPPVVEKQDEACPFQITQRPLSETPRYGSHSHAVDALNTLPYESTLQEDTDVSYHYNRNDKRAIEKRKREVHLNGSIIANHATDEEVRGYVEDQKKDVFVYGMPDKTITLEQCEAFLDSRLLHNIKHLQGYKSLVPLQERCLAIILDKSKPNVLVESPTGSGKTAAFCIPAVQYAINNKGNGPSVIIICNTMNLALQTVEHLSYFTGRILQETARKKNVEAKNTGVEVFSLFKGGMDARRLAPNNQPDIVVATMGSLVDSVEKQRLNLSNLGMFIADEADKMCKEGGFSAEVKDFLELVPSNVMDSMQVTAFSATYTEYETEDGGITLDGTTLGRLFKGFMPVRIKLIGVKGYIKQRIIYISNEMKSIASEDFKDTRKRAEHGRLLLRTSYHSKKLGWLLSLLNHDRDQFYQNEKFTKTAVVFVERITTSNFLATYLLMKGYKVAPLNSNYDLKSAREILQKLADGEIQAVISTNKLARGQDIPDLYHVIVYEMSGEFTDYKHRIGRTGRIGKGGISTALLTPQDRKHFGNLYFFLAEHNQIVPSWLHEQFKAENDMRQMHNAQPSAYDWSQQNSELETEEGHNG